jgi:hypothetical protein
MPIDADEFLAQIKGERPAKPTLPAERQQVTSTGASALPIVSDKARDGGSALAEKLERVTEKALDKLDAILDRPLPDADDENCKTELSAQNTAAATALTTQTKVNDNQLKKKTLDVVAATVKEMLAWRRANPLLIPRGMTIEHEDEPKPEPEPERDWHKTNGDDDG